MGDEVTLFDAVGGQPFFDLLVGAFYDGVATDEVLLPMYPADLTEPKRHLSLFLGQYWGGPPDYQSERGHPRLRMRHAPFAIDVAARDRWLSHMRTAVAAQDPSPEIQARLIDYFEYAADSMRNVPEEIPD